MMLATLLLLAAAGEGAAAPPAPTLRHHEGPMAKVLEEAKASGRPVLVDFFTTWCGPCKWMDANVFTDADVIRSLNEGFVVYKVDAEKGEGVDLAKKYRIEAYPTFLTVDAAGEELDRKIGGSPKARFLALLKDIRAGEHVRGLRGKVEKDPKDARSRAKLGIRLSANDDESARDHLEKAIELDPKDGVPETVEARFTLAVLDLQRDQSLESVAAFARKYPDSASAVDAHRILVGFAKQMQDEDGERASLEFLVKREPDAELRNELSWFLATRGLEVERALGLVDEALKAEPKNAAFLDTRAECLSRLGKHEEAVAEQKRAIENLGPRTRPEERAEYEKRLAEFEKKRDAAKK